LLTAILIVCMISLCCSSNISSSLLIID